VAAAPARRRLAGALDRFKEPSEQAKGPGSNGLMPKWNHELTLFRSGFSLYFIYTDTVSAFYFLHLSRCSD
jgi:hypothetical protein